MIEEKQHLFMLIDAYENLLTSRQKEILHDYYYNDFSLFEIAESLGISKQAVKDSLDKAMRNLQKYEDALHLVKKQLKFNLLIQQKSNLEMEYYTKSLENLFKE